MTESGSDVYADLGVPTVVNATGTKTRIGGSRIREEAVEAMAAAAESFVLLSDLQAKASEVIADVTGAEAGYVTSGAAAGLTLATAACLAGDDPSRMDRLPGTDGFPSDVVAPRTHRTSYDHAIRTAGASIVDVGTNDYVLGTGSSNVEPWEIDAAIDEDTAAVFYLQKPYTKPDLPVVADVAHENDVPVIVDAAAELPPKENLSRFVEGGADLVVFSGGKAIRGPQTTGIVAGKERYVRSIAVQNLDMHVTDEVWESSEGSAVRANVDGVPRQGIGRPMKVGKEEIVGLLVALRSFVDEDHDALREQWRTTARWMVERLSDAGLSAELSPSDGTSVSAEVVFRLDPAVDGLSAVDLARALQAEDPRVYVGSDRLDDGEVVLNPMCLGDEEPEYVVERILANIE